MKNFLLKNSLYFLVMLGIASPAFAQSSYDNTTLHFSNNSGEGDSNVYVTFSGASYNITYFDTSNSTTVDLNEPSGAFSTSIPLSNVMGGNFNVYFANSAVGYVSYGTTLETSPPPTVSNPSLPSYQQRWGDIEFTRGLPGGYDNGDATDINQFAASLSIKNYSGTFGSLTPTVGISGIVGTSTGDIMHSVYNNLYNISPSIPSFNYLPSPATPATFVTVGNTSTGTLVRITAPNSFPAAVQPQYGTYPSFGNYFTYIKDNHIAANISNQTYQIDNWKYVYNFTATINATGNYVLTGNVAASDLSSSANLTENLTITLPNDADTGGSLSTLMYQEPGTTASLALGVVLGGNWTGIENAQPGKSADVITNLPARILGDLEEGINIGAVGSNVTFNGTAVGDMTSTQWFGYNPHQFFGNVSAGNYYYNVYSAALYTAIGNDSVAYFAPYDDRFQSADANPDIAMDTLWDVTLNPDGNMVIPEPSTYALIFSGFSGAMAMAARAFRRRKNRTEGEARSSS